MNRDEQPALQILPAHVLEDGGTLTRYRKQIASRRRYMCGTRAIDRLLPDEMFLRNRYIVTTFAVIPRQNY